MPLSNRLAIMHSIFHELNGRPRMIDWHRLFGLALKDFFTDSPFEVGVEKDLSQKLQKLDIVILRREAGEFHEPLPDGFQDLSNHNLITYKSLREPFDDWVLKELTGHYVNYRKQVSPGLEQLLPEESFHLYGVSTRFPRKLFAQLRNKPEKLSEGVYEIVRGTDAIRLIVLSEIPRKPNNTLWHLFSGVQELVEYAWREYRQHTPEMSTIINQLFDNYRLEGLNMPYTMEDFQKDYVREHLNVLSPDEILKRYSPDERLSGLASDEVLKHYSPDEIQRYLEKLQKSEEK